MASEKQESVRLNTFDEALEAVKLGNFVIVVVSGAECTVRNL